jgi:hypothetical protein
MTLRSFIISLAIAAIIGVVIGLILQAPRLTPSSSPLSSSANNSQSGLYGNAQTQTPDLAELSQQLQQEIFARRQLQQEVTTLGKKLAALTITKSTRQAHSENQASGADQDTATETAQDVWFNQQALIDAGMTESEAEQLKTHFEELELEKLYLRDQAIREGWSGGKRYRDELQKLEAKTEDIKQELGEDAYDAYLFAAGQPNRVTVQSVLSSSAAGNAGIVAGDQVIRYAGERIYNWRDLRDATTRGDLSETVPMEILRDDKPMELYVQRGPLGIRMDSISVAP